MNDILSLIDKTLEPEAARHATDHLFYSAKRYLDDSLSAATQKAYRSDWRVFEEFCKRYTLSALPADTQTALLFLTEQADAALCDVTVGRRAAAIKYVHTGKGFSDPCAAPVISAFLRGVRRKQAERIIAAKKPVSAEMINHMIAACDPNRLTGVRDRALILFGFAGAFRRSEITAVNLEDLTESADGIKVTIRKSKTDQEGAGRTVALPHGEKLNITESVKNWISYARIGEGALFRAVLKGGKRTGGRLSPLSVNLIIKKYAEITGLKPQDFGAHSLRSGFLTAAAQNGASVFKMAEVSGHKSLDTVRRYVRDADLFKNHAGEGFL